MNMKMALAATLTSLAMAATPVLANQQMVEKPVLTGKLGDQIFLMDANKMTLYVFDKDSKGVSNCYDACAEKWPPLLGEKGMKLPHGYSLIERKDGTLQIAYKGMPLYLWFKDHNPGDMTGDGVKGVWHVARP